MYVPVIKFSVMSRHGRQIPVEPRHEKTRLLPMRKQRRTSATAQLISTFVFAKQIVWSRMELGNI